MSSEARKDELRMSWNKKVSMREIAQFYEDKLRELSAKQTGLMEEINRKQTSIDTKMEELGNSLRDIKNFIEELDNVKKYIEAKKDEITAQNGSIKAHLNTLDKLYERTNIEISNLNKKYGIIKKQEEIPGFVYGVSQSRNLEHAIAAVYVQVKLLGKFIISILASDKEFIEGMKYLLKNEEFESKLLTSAEITIRNIFIAFHGYLPYDDSEIKDYARDSVANFIEGIEKQLDSIIRGMETNDILNSEREGGR